MASQPALRGVGTRRRSPAEAERRAHWISSITPGRIAEALLAEPARPLRFILVGGVCALLQLALLVLLTGTGCAPLPANTAAYLLSAQANFVLSDRFIWHDRRTERSRQGIGRRWLSFHASIAGTFLLNEAVFVVARVALPDVVAAATGIGSAAIVNFVIQDALTFR
jgi:putative flippase GtrA